MAKTYCDLCKTFYAEGYARCPNCILRDGEQQEATRHDQGKPRMDLLPGDALLDIAEVFTWGAEKYSDRNWEKGMEWHKLFAPIERHLWKWWQGEELDEESGKHHLAHAACDVLMLLASVKRGIGEDDRPDTKSLLQKAYDNCAKAEAEKEKQWSASALAQLS